MEWDDEDGATLPQVGGPDGHVGPAGRNKHMSLCLATLTEGRGPGSTAEARITAALAALLFCCSAIAAVAACEGGAAPFQLPFCLQFISEALLQSKRHFTTRRHSVMLPIARSLSARRSHST